ncbi:MAG: M23 family metallopeptidase [Pseudomonadota bacterium]
MVDRRRHAPSRRFRNPNIASTARGLPQVYQGRARRTYSDVYDSDHSGGGFRWLISTCVAAGVGALVIVIVIAGSIDRNPSIDSVMTQIADAQKPAAVPIQRRDATGGLNWAVPKSSLRQVTSGALSARYTIHEQVSVRRNDRKFIEVRPYLRVVARLATTSAKNADVIPPLNPIRLYQTKASNAAGRNSTESTSSTGQIKVRVVELLGGILPEDDGRELDSQAVRDLVQQSYLPADNIAPSTTAFENTGQLPSGLTPNYLAPGGLGLNPVEQIDSNITVITRKVADEDTSTSDASDDPSEVRVVSIGKGDSIARILQRLGAPDWLGSAMIESAKGVFSLNDIAPGQQMHVQMVPALTKPGYMEPAGFSLFGPGHTHLLSVRRDSGGTFRASKEIDRATLLRTLNRSANSSGSSTLYSGIYDTGLTQNLSPDQIMKILRIHAYETDFRRRIRQGDQIEWFFDLRPQRSGPPQLGALLYTSITAGGEKQRFWRFRTRDGIIDYYDENGENSKKFLMRKPVRGSAVRLTSGFGFRRHPVLKQRRMHTGIDYAGPRGTPILAAGKGVIDEARRRGTYGNYIRIKHANGYKTAYAHLHRFGKGITKGVKVRQGQIIGYLGNTGLSSGPHLHYEVLVNQRFVNPLKIKVPQARRLAGGELDEFKRKREQIDDLMARPPVETQGR